MVNKRLTNGYEMFWAANQRFGRLTNALDSYPTINWQFGQLMSWAEPFRLF